MTDNHPITLLWVFPALPYANTSRCSYLLSLSLHLAPIKSNYYILLIKNVPGNLSRWMPGVCAHPFIRSRGISQGPTSKQMAHPNWAIWGAFARRLFLGCEWNKTLVLITRGLAGIVTFILGCSQPEVLLQGRNERYYLSPHWLSPTRSQRARGPLAQPPGVLNMVDGLESG